MSLGSEATESDFQQRLHAAFKRADLQAGEWTTYSDVAEALGDPDSAIAVGTHLMECRRCHPYALRVLNKGGVPNPRWRRTNTADTSTQREVLEAEGLRFIDGKADPQRRITPDRFSASVGVGTQNLNVCPEHFLRPTAGGMCPECGRNLGQLGGNEAGSFAAADRELGDWKVPEGEEDPIIGGIPGVPVGTSWNNRAQVAAAGIHRPHMAGICGTRTTGAESIVVNGGYVDDRDQGSIIIYTGAGGRDPSSGHQIADQTLDQPGNAALVTSHLSQLPVRVVRGPGSDWSGRPDAGFRYDGLFMVEDHWGEVGKDGFWIWRYRLVQLVPVAEQKVESGDGDGGRVGRVLGVVNRPIRDGRISMFVKELYGYRCQICGIELEVPGGRIAEGAHIRALGEPHNGPDVRGNILCLCPNHHAVFDAGGIYVGDDLVVRDHNGEEVGTLHVRRAHRLSSEHLKYHREHVWTEKV